MLELFRRLHHHFPNKWNHLNYDPDKDHLVLNLLIRGQWHMFIVTDEELANPEQLIRDLKALIERE